MSESAFGVDHGYDPISKIELRPLKFSNPFARAGKAVPAPARGTVVGSNAGKAVRSGAIKAKAGVVSGAKAAPSATISGMGSAIGNKISSLSKPLGQSAGKSFASGNNNLGHVQARMGQGAKRLGGAMSAHPVATGGTVLGAGGAGIYGAGHHNGKPRWVQS